MTACGPLKAVLAAAVLLPVSAASALAQAAASTSADSPSAFFADRIERIGEHLDTVARAIPSLPGYLRGVADSVERAAGQTSAGRFVLVVLLCLAAGALVEWAVRRGTRALRERRHGAPIAAVSDRLAVVGVDAAIELGAIAGFAVGALAMIVIFGRPGPINEAGSSYLVALVCLRLASGMLDILLRPSAGPDRVFSAFELEPPAARFWHRRMSLLVGWFAFGWAVVVTTRAFGMPRDGQLLFAYGLGIGLVVIALTMIWHPSVRPQEDSQAGNGGRWLASLGLLLFWLVWAVSAMPMFWFLTVAFGLPLAIRTVRRAARHLLRPVGATDNDAAIPSVASVFVEQGIRALLIAGGIWILLWGWKLDMGELAAQENVYSRLLRGSLHALVIILAADLAWGLIKALADNALARAQTAIGVDANEARRRARIRTLLPIGRNLAFIVLLVMAGLMVLSALGVEIAPLVASAGVVGVAVGFGAQTVVRDIISGMFYMLDDAFRVGEYIQSGNYKGTVESFSLRSIKLRHQRGALFTIPFGTLGAVQNMSRDWVIVKDVIGITYDSDIDMAKKLIKQIGIDLAKDPDLGPNILQPLKMQGVEAFGDYAIQIRTKMMTKPGEQFVIRRRANAMIKKAFDANGVSFAFPTVQVARGADDIAAVAGKQVLNKMAG